MKKRKYAQNLGQQKSKKWIQQRGNRDKAAILYYLYTFSSYLKAALKANNTLERGIWKK